MFESASCPSEQQISRWLQTVNKETSFVDIVKGFLNGLLAADLERFNTPHVENVSLP